MGQEASLPQAGDEDEFEHQARAPPSSSNPPLSNPQKMNNPRAAGKMIGAVFHKATHRGGNSQIDTNRSLGVDEVEIKNEADDQPYGGQNVENGSHPGVISPLVTPTGSNIPAPTANHPGFNPNMLTPEQQQQYYQQQQQMYQIQQQSTMMPNQYYHRQQNDGQQQFVVSPPGQPLPPTSVTHHHQADPVYNNATTSQGADGTNNNNNNSAKKGMSFLPAGRGAALINSMRNLSLGTGMIQRATGGGGGGGGTSPRAKEVNDWETRWDEDDDSDGEDQAGLPASSRNQSGAIPPGPLHHSQQLRPAVDAPHSSASAVPMTPAVSGEMRFASPAGLQQTPAQQQAQKAHLITATPESVASQTGAGITPKQQPGLLRQASQEDGLEWDTGALEGQGYEKPNVEMFMPLLRVLGKGSFGKVVLVQKRVGKERGSLFAMKILKKTHLVKRRQIERTRTERKVLSVVNHPFIMKLHFAFQTPDKLYLVLDYCPGGELFFHLSRFRRFPERVARFYSAELLLAIGHLHKRGIIYRDLKPENVLLDADGHVKLGDFGLAKAGIKHPCEGATSMCGTPEYMAPEVLSQQGHGFCVDYWGLGMLVYEMMTGLPPWYTTDRAKLFRRLKSAPLDVPSYFSAPAANCVSALLERNPRRRLGVTGIRTAMEHDFFRSISWRALYGRRVEAPIRPCEGWTPPEANNNNTPESPAGNNNEGGMTMAEIENMNSNDLDAATANFDNTFTRMPVETEDRHDEHSDEGELEELHEDTFVGFTFDEKDRDEVVVSSAMQSTSAEPQQPPRQRTHHNQNYGQNDNTRPID